MKLTLHNRTLWSSTDLRRFIKAGMRAKGVERRTCTVVYGKGKAHGGFGYYHSEEFQLSLPGPTRIRICRNLGTEIIDYLELAQVLEHEIDHTLGLKHADMVEWRDLRPTWHEGLSIAWLGDAKREARAALSSTVERRAAHAKLMLKKAETRLKRAETIRNKWARKVRYYEKGTP